MKHILLAEVKNGKVSKREQIRNIIESFEGKVVEITITKAKKKRSNKQNSYYWAVVIPLVRTGILDMGEKLTNEQTHDFLRQRFLFRDKMLNNGEFLRFAKSTTELTTTEFMDYIAEIQQFGAEFLNISIPDPNQEEYA